MKFSACSHVNIRSEFSNQKPRRTSDSTYIDPKYRERDLVDMLEAIESRIRDKEKSLKKNKALIDKLNNEFVQQLEDEERYKSSAADYYSLGRSILEDIEAKLSEAEAELQQLNITAMK